MKEHREVKPKITFGKFSGFTNYGNGQRTATVLFCEGHPRLGPQGVIYTSAVLEVDNEENPSVIETQNSIYVKR